MVIYGNIKIMDASEIRKWHSVFKRDDELFEIRILGDRNPWSGYFYDIETAIKELERFDNFNIYYSLNEVKSACASREQFNCFRQVKGSATSKTDIEHRWWLAIDVDCERPSGVSSTDEEKAKAHKKAQDVFRFLRDNGFSTPVVCDSSSGFHLLYPIDMDNDQASEDCIKAFLEILSNNFTDESVKIDTVLHDANRILRLSGSYGRKGRSSKERPHRLAKILSVPEEIVRMKIEQILAFNSKYEIKVEQPQRRQYNGNVNGEQFNLREFIAKYGIEVEKEVPISGGGTKYVLKECPFDSQHKAPDSALFELPNGAIAFKCYHNSCSQYDWRAFRLHFDPNAYDHENEPRGYSNQQQQYQPRQHAPQKPKYEIKEEIPELGEKWKSMSSIKKVDIANLEKIKTGFTELDKRIGGIYMTEVIVLSGSNASGKSSWLNSLILNVIDQGEKCALWSGELPDYILKAWIQMVAAGKQNLRQSQFEEGRYYVPDNIGAKIDEWMDGKFFLYNNEYGTEFEQIMSDMKILAKAGVKLFVLDNLMAMGLNFVEGDKNGKQKEVVLAIKRFAQEHNVAVILVAHPRKAMSFLRKNDISGTADLTNAVDGVWIFHRNNEDFQHAVTDFFGAAKANSLSIYGNILAVEKNRLFGVVDYMCGMHYEAESRRFKNTIDEDIRYGWEREPQQNTFEYDDEPSDDMPFEPPTDGAPF